jgi:hypothetical protein
MKSTMLNGYKQLNGVDLFRYKILRGKWPLQLVQSWFWTTQNEITFQVHMKLLKILLTFCVVILHGIKNSEYENIFQETVFAVSLNF